MTDVWAEKRVRLGVGLALIALMLLMQAALFPRQSLWPDEVFSLAMATGHSLEHPAAKADRSKGDFVQTEGSLPAAEWRKYIEHETPAVGPSRVIRAVYLSDTSPPLYYLLLYGWTRLIGPSDWALRLFSVVCGVLSIPLIMRIGDRVGPRSVGTIAAVLFVFSPPVFYYFAEGRMYSLLWVCTLAAADLTLVLREAVARRPWLQIGWIVASAAGLLVHYFFVFPWAAMVAYLAIAPGNDRRWWLVLRLVVVAVLILPWYVHLPETMRMWRVTMDWLLIAPGGFHRVSAARDLLLQFFSGRTLSLWHTPRIAELVVLAVIGFCAVRTGLRLRSKAFAGPRMLIWLWLMAAWLGPLAIDAWRGTYTAALSRYALAGAPAACLLIAGAVAGVAPRWRVVSLVAIVAVWSISLVSIYKWRWRSGAPMREVAQEVGSNPAPTDLILVHSIPSGVLGLAYYAAPSAQIGSWVANLGTRQVPGSLRQMIAGRTRVRFVRIHDVGAAAPEETWLRENAVIEKERKIGPAIVIDFRPNGSVVF